MVKVIALKTDNGLLIMKLKTNHDHPGTYSVLELVLKYLLKKTKPTITTDFFKYLPEGIKAIYKTNYDIFYIQANKKTKEYLKEVIEYQNI